MNAITFDRFARNRGITSFNYLHNGFHKIFTSAVVYVFMSASDRHLALFKYVWASKILQILIIDSICYHNNFQQGNSFNMRTFDFLTHWLIVTSIEESLIKIICSFFNLYFSSICIHWLVQQISHFLCNSYLYFLYTRIQHLESLYCWELPEQ